MKIQANTIRPGYVIEHAGKQMSVIKIQLIQPGKGGAFIQVEMRDVATGVKTNERWRTQETVEKLTVDEREFNYLYADGDMLTFMDNETYEQVALPRDILGDAAPWAPRGGRRSRPAGAGRGDPDRGSRRGCGAPVLSPARRPALSSTTSLTSSRAAGRWPRASSRRRRCRGRTPSSASPRASVS